MEVEILRTNVAMMVTSTLRSIINPWKDISQGKFTYVFLDRKRAWIKFQPKDREVWDEFRPCPANRESEELRYNLGSQGRL